MRHIYLEQTSFAREARAYFMAYLKVHLTLCTASILVIVTIYSEAVDSVSVNDLVLSLYLFIASIVLVVITMIGFIAYIAEHKRASNFLLITCKVTSLCSFMAYLLGLLIFISAFQPQIESPCACSGCCDALNAMHLLRKDK